MNFKTLNIVAAAAIVGAVMAAPAYAQMGSNPPGAAPAAAAPAAPAAPANPGAMNVAPGHVNPSAGINNRSNFTASRPSGARTYARNDRGTWDRRHHHRRHSNGFAFVPFGYYGPDYYDDYAYEAAPDCTLQRRIFRTRSGRRHVRWVQVCD